MWDIHEEITREAKSRGNEKDKKRRIQEARDRFVSHSMHDMYLEHVRSDEGRAELHRLIRKWTNR